MDVRNPYEIFDVVRRHAVESIVSLIAPPARSLSTQADYEPYTVGLQNVLEAARTFGLRRVSLGSSVAVYGGRIGSVYGPRYYSMHNPISRLCHAAVKNAEPDFSDRPGGKIFEDDQGDWTYVKDVARGIQMVHTAKTLSHRVFNVASGGSSSNKDAFAAVRKAVPAARCAALQPGRTPGASTNPATDRSRIKGDVGYEPEYTLETGIAAYIDWLRSHPQ